MVLGVDDEDGDEAEKATEDSATEDATGEEAVVGAEGDEDGAEDGAETGTDDNEKGPDAEEHGDLAEAETFKRLIGEGHVPAGLACFG